MVMNGTKVDPGAVIYLLSDIVNRAARSSINDSQQFGQVSTDDLNAIYKHLL